MGKHSFKLDKFPFKQVLSLEKLLEYWIGKTSSQDPLEKEFAIRIVDRAKKVPKLFLESPSTSLVDKNSYLLTHMIGALASPLKGDSDIWGISSPTKFEFILTTSKMDELFGKRAKALSKIFFDSIYGEN